MIELYEGVPGSGKSYNCVKDKFLPWLRHGRRPADLSLTPLNFLAPVRRSSVAGAASFRFLAGRAFSERPFDKIEP